LGGRPIERTTQGVPVNVWAVEITDGEDDEEDEGVWG